MVRFDHSGVWAQCAAPQKVYTETPKKSAQVFRWKIKILYLPTPSFWSKRVKL
jgi:hypothetical protein